MGNLVENRCQAVCVFSIVLFGVGMCLAQNDEGRFSLQIPTDPEIESLLESHNFLKAEQSAREKNLDPRVVATLCAKNGKNEEAFILFQSFIQEAPHDRKKELAFQAVNLLRRNVSVELGEDFFYFLIENSILDISDERVSCAEIAILGRNGKIEEAQRKLNLLLDSPYAEDDIISVVFLLASNLEREPQSFGIVLEWFEKLLKKFPDKLRVKLHWIDALANQEPKRALLELDNLRKDSSEFYTEQRTVVHLIRGKAFEKLGESDRAESEYLALFGTEAESVAKAKIREYNWKKSIERDLREKMALENQPYEIPVSHSPWGIIIGVNAVIIVIMIYLIYRKKKR